MDIELIKLLIDTGLFILIWIIQLVIYPSFLYYSEQDLNRWHAAYTQRISIVVMPLMLGQVFFYGYGILLDWQTVDIFLCVLILFNWLVTFLSAVPLHNRIQLANNSMQARQKLLRINWFRTIAWTLIFLINLTTYYAK
jgi:hypothetical protein